MANGDAAAAAGMDIVPSTADRSMGYDEINKSRDYIALRTDTVVPVAKGGTGGTSASAARTNLGLKDTYDKVANASTSPAQGELFMAGTDGRVNVGEPTNPSNAATKNYVDSNDVKRLWKAGDTMTGHLSLAVCTAVTSGYVAMYRNGDGRVGLTPSARHYKRGVKAYAGSALDLQPRLYVLKDDPAQEVRVGLVAEEVAGVEPLLVVYNDDGTPESVRYELLAVVLLADVQRLTAEVRHQQAAVAALTARVAALEEAGA